ncbi:MAG TPA: tetratricopeptide repeat protein, partial [Tepidisphaeraceae bacterium]|nr:tetratricopeptide repeat protein [Tepidisphaeraceae bacterium]
WLAWWRCIRHGGKRGLIASGLGFTLAAVTLHSALDFGQHLPANAIVTAIAAAALLRLGCPAAITGQERLPSRGWVVAGGMVMLLSAGLIWSCFAADRHRRAVAAMDESTRLADALGVARWQGSKADFDRMVASAAEAVSIAPRNAKAQYTLGVARFWSLMRERQARFDPAADARALNESLESFRAAAISAPLYGPPYSMAGQALGAFGKAEVGDALIETAAELSPQDGWTLALAGEARLRRGDPAGAMSRFRRAIGTSGIDPGYIIRRLLRVYDRVDLALELTGENQATLSEIAEYLRKQARHGEAAAVDDRIFTAAIRRAELSTASASALAHAARMLEKRGRNDEAITLYQRGLALDPQQHQWRLSVAKLLAAANQFAAAEREIRTILRDQPDWAEARVLGAEIRQRAATQPSQ